MIIALQEGGESSAAKTFSPFRAGQDEEYSLYANSFTVLNPSLSNMCCEARAVASVKAYLNPLSLASARALCTSMDAIPLPPNS